MVAASLSGGKAGPAKARIGDWWVDASRNELAREGESVRLEPKVIEVLVHLASRPGEVVPREELLAGVWPGVVVGDDVLTQAIIKLRKALGDDAHRPKYIETISKRGYRLIAPVEGPAPPPAVAGRTWRGRNALAIAAAGLAVVGGIAFLAKSRLADGIPRPWPIAADTRGTSVTVPIVAVLPLANLSGDPAREYFSDGVTEDIIAGLGRFFGLRVMSLRAVEGFKGRAPSPQAVRDELRARYVVKGSVREADGKVRIAVELSDAEKGVSLWADRFEGQGGQLFEIQDRIVRSIVGALHVKVTQLEQQRVFTRPTEALDAHDLVLRARSLLHRLDRRSNREARALLARARELAPDYAEVLTALGESEVQRALYGWVETPEESMRRAEELARQALASVDVRAHTRAHSLLSSVYSNMDRPVDSLRHADLALAANPSDATALYRKGSAVLFGGNAEAAIPILEEARHINPQVGGNTGNVAYAYYCAGRYGDAIALIETMLTPYPDDIMLRALRTATLAQLGRTEEARDASTQVRRLSPRFEVAKFGLRFGESPYSAKLREGLVKAGLE